MDYLENSRRQLAALREKEHVRILAIETSCDETAAAVVEDGRKILSNAVFTQIDLHALYGGVVPEIASRAHVEKVDRMVDEALRQEKDAADYQVEAALWRSAVNGSTTAQIYWLKNRRGGAWRDKPEPDETASFEDCLAAVTGDEF